MMDFRQISTFFAAGAAALVGGAFLYATGTPLEVETEQTGYRGTGMALIQNADTAAALARAQEAIPPSEEPWIPEEGEVLARDAYQNVQVLGDLTETNFTRLMTAMTEWVSPDQGCAYCHGDEGEFASDALYTKVVSRRMLEMTRHINANLQDHVAQTGVTCYTCHRGQPVPGAIWFDDPAPRAGMSAGADRALQNRPLDANAFSSLPADALEAYLAGDAPIRVASLTPRAPNAGAPNIKDTERTYSLMLHFSQSLGVNCDFCHNTRAFYSWEQSPPQRAVAWHGIRMARTLNQVYLEPLQSVFPENRLGPTGDAPKLNCATCHRGAQKPLGGQSMLAEWPELRTEGAPVYE